MQNNKTVAIIGGGPVGLAAAAHLTKRDIPFILFEAGNQVGSNFLEWGHVQVFSPWRYNIDKVAEELLSQSSWVIPDKEALPTGKELVENYFKPLSELPGIAPNIHLNSKVVSIGRKGLDKMKSAGRENLPFNILVNEKGEIKSYEVKSVIDATGTWNQPNPIGSGGIPAVGESSLKENIFYGIPDVKNRFIDRYKNKNIVVVGSGHSAVNTLLDLASLQEDFPETKINWVLRKELRRVYGGKEEDALEARGALGIRIENLVNSGRLKVYTPYYINRVYKDENGIRVQGQLNGKNVEIEEINEIISNTGARPNLDFLREIRLDMDASLESVYDLAPLIDPNVHSCGTVRPHGEKELRQPEKDFYIVGSKSYGRAPTFLMATGYEQVRSVVAYLDGDFEAAKRVELDLPQTGVCSTDFDDSACCGVEVAVGEDDSCASC